MTYSISSLGCIVLSGITLETFLVGELARDSPLFFELTFDVVVLLVARFRLPSPDFSPLAAPLFSLPNAPEEGADARL